MAKFLFFFFFSFNIFFSHFVIFFLWPTDEFCDNFSWQTSEFHVSPPPPPPQSINFSRDQLMNFVIFSCYSLLLCFLLVTDWWIYSFFFFYGLLPKHSFFLSCAWLKNFAIFKATNWWILHFFSHNKLKIFCNIFLQPIDEYHNIRRTTKWQNLRFFPCDQLRNFAIFFLVTD